VQPLGCEHILDPGALNPILAGLDPAVDPSPEGADRASVGYGAEIHEHRIWLEGVAGQKSVRVGTMFGCPKPAIVRKELTSEIGYLGGREEWKHLAIPFDGDSGIAPENLGDPGMNPAQVGPAIWKLEGDLHFFRNAVRRAHRSKEVGGGIGSHLLGLSGLVYRVDARFGSVPRLGIGKGWHICRRICLRFSWGLGGTTGVGEGNRT
jgi:hypothetical protein